jgi:transcriptional regulator with XRE-family HTH domain
MKFKYVVKLKQAHEETGLSAYMVAKRTGVSINTVDRYAKKDSVEIDQLNIGVAILADFYGVPFHEAVQVIKQDEESPEKETLVA